MVRYVLSAARPMQIRGYLLCYENTALVEDNRKRAKTNFLGCYVNGTCKSFRKADC